MRPIFHVSTDAVSLSITVSRYRLTAHVCAVPLFEVEALVGQVNVDQGDLADADEDEDSDDTDKPVGRVRYALGRANAVAGLCFQWIPPYRVYATGEQFWQVLQLKDTAWKNLAVEEEEREAEERKARRKAKL